MVIMISGDEKELTSRRLTDHEFIYLAEQRRPAQPEGNYQGRPYYKLLLPLPDIPDAGQYIWWDANFEVWREIVGTSEYWKRLFEFLVPIEVAVELSGGLGAILSKALGRSFEGSTSASGMLTEIFNEKTSQYVEALLQLIDQQRLKGTFWLDIGSADGRLTAEIGRKHQLGRYPFPKHLVYHL